MKNNILAIDPATQLGYATSIGESGSISFKEGKDESKSFRFYRFRKWLLQVLFNNNINIIVYEKPSGQHFTGVRSGFNFEGVILSVAAELDIDYKAVPAMAIKKHAKEATKTNIKGAVKKSHMIEMAQNYFKTDIVDDNHADALWLLSYIKTEING